MKKNLIAGLVVAIAMTGFFGNNASAAEPSIEAKTWVQSSSVDAWGHVETSNSVWRNRVTLDSGNGLLGAIYAETSSGGAVAEYGNWTTIGVKTTFGALTAGGEYISLGNDHGKILRPYVEIDQPLGRGFAFLGGAAYDQATIKGSVVFSGHSYGWERKFSGAMYYGGIGAKSVPDSELQVGQLQVGGSVVATSENRHYATTNATSFFMPKAEMACKVASFATLQASVFHINGETPIVVGLSIKF